MSIFKRLTLVTASCVAAICGTAVADTKVEIKKTHVCCGACEKAVASVLDKAGVKGSADQATGTITFTASDEKAAQKVVDDLAAAGFHGDTGQKAVTVKDDSGVKEGKVSSLTLTGVHNCCGACTKAIKEALKKVDGVTSDDTKAKSETITITGNFDGKAAVKALNDAGFHAVVPKEKEKGK